MSSFTQGYQNEQVIIFDINFDQKYISKLFSDNKLEVNAVIYKTIAVCVIR